MYARLFTIAVFASGAVAAENWQRMDSATALAIRSLQARQGSAFVPGTSQGFGETCASAFGEGHIECATSGICYNPDEGQICCDAGYPCPAGSFCIGEGRCCPDGLTAETCAEMFSSAAPSSTAAPTTSSSAPPAPAYTSSEPSSSAGGVKTLTTTICTTSATSKYPYPTATGAPTSGYPKPTGTFTPPPPFEDAANVHSVAFGTLAVAAVLAAFNLF